MMQLRRFFSYQSTACSLGTLLLCTLVVHSTAQAEIFREITPDGEIIYTDKPSGDRQPHELPPLNTLPAAPTPPKPAAAPQAPEAPVFKYKRLRIASPADDTAPDNLAGDINVVVEIKPKLHKTHQLRLLLDGKAVATSKKTTFSLTNVFRGTHSLQVEVINDKKALLKRSKKINVHIFRPSVFINGNGSG